MRIRLLFITVGAAALVAGAASAQGRPGGAAPGQSMRPSMPAPPMPRATLPSGAANVGAGISATARATRSGEAVRSEARERRSASAGANAHAAANADANAGFPAATAGDDQPRNRSAEARSHRRGPERADDRAVERSNDHAGLRSDTTRRLSDREARAITADLNRRSLEGSLNVGADVRAEARAGRASPDRANTHGVENSNDNAGLREERTASPTPRRRN